jgi:hypothetical protein
VAADNEKFINSALLLAVDEFPFPARGERKKKRNNKALLGARLHYLREA